MWGTIGIGYNVKKAREVLGGDGRIDSWDIVFKPENLAKFKDCGVHMLDAADDVFSTALHFLKLNPNTKDQADLEKAADVLTKIRPLVRKFHSSEYLNALASGEICLVLGFSGDIKQAQKRAVGGEERHRDRLRDPERGRAALVRQSLDPEGCEERRGGARADRLSAQAGGRGEEFERRLIRERQRGEPVKFIDKAIIEDKTVYPDEAAMKTFYTLSAHDQKTQRLINRLWTRIKTGK